jgi:mRNA interferase RelE/StbE
MAYNILFTSRSKKQFSKLTKDIRIRITNYLENKVQINPLLYGKNLTGDKKGLYRYRIGDYRIICHINNKDIVVLILDIGHRKEVYN